MQKKYTEFSREELEAEFSALSARYAKLRDSKLSLNMARGKPGPDQLELSLRLLDLVSSASDCKSEDGTDCRNYGGLDGLSEIKRLFGEILGVDPSQVVAGGNSSLNMMFDTVAEGMTHGFGGNEPWLKQGDIKFICPSPGYDRHFMICEHFGIDMIPVPLNSDGPDMDIVERLVKDEKVKGMWCVPKYSNPSGVSYSDEVVRRIAALSPAAPDFRIFWDNAYVIHHLEFPGDKILNIYDECLRRGHEDMPIIFASTSKITFPGAGVAAEAASPRNIAEIKKRMSFQTIGPDKLNHLRHARMFKNLSDVENHMRRQAELLRPKFGAVLSGLEKELSGLGIANWNEPKGGYFISLFVLPGTAKRTVALCKDAGLILTPAGAAYPYGIDPQDSNIRIAPSYPLPDELTAATELLCVSARLAALEKLLG